METLNRLKTTLLLLVLTLGSFGCAKNLPTTVSSGRPHSPLDPTALKDTVVGLADERIDLSTYQDMPLVVVFAYDQCEGCAVETEELLASLKNRTVAPENVRIVTIMAHVYPEDAQTWQAIHKVPWTVALDPGDALFDKFCPSGQTPCTIIQMPGRGIVFRKEDVSTAAELEAVTGPWEEP